MPDETWSRREWPILNAVVHALAGDYIIHVPIHSIERASHADTQCLAEWQRDGAFDQVLAAILAAVRRDERTRPPFELISRLRSNNVEGTGDGVVPEEGALRPFEDFDMVQVEKRGGRRT